MSEDASTTVDLDRLMARAHAERPDLVANTDFAAFLRSKVDDPAQPDQLSAGDLLLAHACGCGDTKALARFEEECIGAIGRVLGHMQLPAETVDEVKQRVRTKLLVAEQDNLPRLLDYAGKGPLRNWVGVVATREALSALRKTKPPASDEVLMDLESPDVGPELDYLKEHYRAAFATAFSEALSELTPRARNALRHHYLHGMSIDEIGLVYGIHRSNAARRIGKARDELLSATRRRLVLGLDVDRQEFESIMRLIESRIDISLRGALSDDDGS